MPKRHVLVVDDDPDVLMMMDQLLEQAGYRVSRSQSPEYALEILQNPARRIDVIVSDFSMDGMNGIELIRQAFASRPGLRFILISGEGNCRSCLRKDDLFLLKPFTPTALLEELERIPAENSHRVSSRFRHTVEWSGAERRRIPE